MNGIKHDADDLANAKRFAINLKNIQLKEPTSRPIEIHSFCRGSLQLFLPYQSDQFIISTTFFEICLINLSTHKGSQIPRCKPVQFFNYLKIVEKMLIIAKETIVIWDIENNKELMQLEGHKSNVYYAYKDANLLFTVSQDQKIIVWNLDLKEKQQVAELTLPIKPFSLLFLIDMFRYKDKLFTLSSSKGHRVREGSIVVWDANNNYQCLLDLTVNNATCMQIHENSLFVGLVDTTFVGLVDTTVMAWNLDTNHQEIVFTETHQQRIQSIKVYGKNLYICLENEIVVLSLLNNYQEVGRLNHREEKSVINQSEAENVLPKNSIKNNFLKDNLYFHENKLCTMNEVMYYIWNLFTFQLARKGFKNVPSKYHDFPQFLHFIENQFIFTHDHATKINIRDFNESIDNESIDTSKGGN